MFARGTKGRRLLRMGLATAGFCLFLETYTMSLLSASSSAPHRSPGAWCERVMPGPSGSAPGALGMSAAHALVRFFGAGGGYAMADSALATALEGDTVSWDAVARAYAGTLRDVCALPGSRERHLPAVQVELVGVLARILPGEGEVVLPAGTRAVAIDLRGLPAVPGLEAALARAVAATSARPIPRTSVRVRVHEGMTDELDDTNVYKNSTELLESPPYSSSGKRELPVALLTGPTLAPAAARFAVDLRLARRAWILGESVATEVAEARWVPVESWGLVVRAELLEDSEGVVPDVIPADRTLEGSWAGLLEGLLGADGPPAVERWGRVSRSLMAPRLPSDEPPHDSAASPGIARAGLLISHGAVRRFFPYFHVVGDGIDARLLETLAQVGPGAWERPRVVRLLRRFSEVLQDGHGTGFAGRHAYAGVFPVIWDKVGGDAVIRHSLVPDVHPGDTLVSVDGRPAARWLAEELARTSAATPQRRFLGAAWRLVDMDGPRELGFRALDGHVRFVRVEPQPESVRSQLGVALSTRRTGWLGDLGAPSLYFINLSSGVLQDMDAFKTALWEASSASGLVLDMRGYPGINHFEVAQHLIRREFRAPICRVPRWKGPDMREMNEEQSTLRPASFPSFTQPIVLLVGPGTESAAENLAMLLVGAGRVRVVGRRTAGTNGNITMLALPGRLRFVFSGMEILFQDRALFHGVGIVPDVGVHPTVEDFHAGRDPELLRAIELLR